MKKSNQISVFAKIVQLHSLPSLTALQNIYKSLELMMQTLSPTARNKMRIIYPAHGKHQSSEIKKRGTKEIALDGLRGTTLGQKKQVPFMQATKTHQRENWRM